MQNEVEEDACYYEIPLVGKYLWNKRKKGTKITGVLDLAVPIRLARQEPPQEVLKEEE